jgi:hypothetical protein
MCSADFCDLVPSGWPYGRPRWPVGRVLSRIPSVGRCAEPRERAHVVAPCGCASRLHLVQIKSHDFMSHALEDAGAGSAPPAPAVPASAQCDNCAEARRRYRRVTLPTLGSRSTVQQHGRRFVRRRRAKTERWGRRTAKLRPSPAAFSAVTCVPPANAATPYKTGANW